MASPFTVFRKHQKAFIVALTIMTMFGFVFIPMILDNMRVGRVTDPVVVTTAKYGKLTQSEVGRMVQRHAGLLNIFQSAVLQAQRLPNNEVYAQQIRSELQQVFGPATQESVVNRWLLTQRAQELGMEVSDETINEFLKQFTAGRLGNDEWTKLVERHGLGAKQFFALVRNELLAQRFQAVSLLGVAAMTPAQQWEHFARLHRTAAIEALAVPASDYVAQVSEPDADVVRAFFEEHKNDYNMPSLSPTPGFREPEKVNVRYFRLTPAGVTDSVSEKDIKEYIEKNKDKLEREYQTYQAEQKKLEEAKAKEKKAEEKKTEEKKPEEEKKAGEKKTEEKKTEEKKTEGTKTEEKTPEGKAEEEKKTEEKGEAGKEAGKGPGADETSALPAGSPFRFASLLQEGAAADKTAEKTAEEGAEKTAAPPAEKTAEKTGEEKPEKTGEKPEKTGEKPEKTGEKPEKTGEKPPAEPEEKPAAKSGVPAAAKTGEKPEVEKPAVPAKEPPKEKPEPAIEPPVPEVILPTEAQWIENKVRRELVQKQYDEAREKLRDELKTWGDQLRDYKNGTRKKEPVTPNFAVLAAKYGATTDVTGLKSIGEMSELEIAKSSGPSGAGFLALLYTNPAESSRAQLSLYQVETTFQPSPPSQIFPIPETTYVFCKIEDEPEKSLTWDEEGTPALATEKWKEVQARKLAYQAATDLARRVREAKKPLKEVFADRAVITPAPFTWMTEGVPRSLFGGGEPPRLSKPKGIEQPGDGFMRSVFNLSPGEVGVAMNHPESVAYVVYLKSVEPPDYSLWATFEATKPSVYADVGAGDVRRTVNAWMKQVQTDAGLKWEIAPDRPASAAPAQQ